MINDALVQSNDYVPTGELSVSFLAPIQKLFPNIYSELIEYIDARTVCSKKFGDRYLNSIITVLDGELYDYYKTNFADVLDRFCAQHVLPTVVMTLPGEPNSLLLKELFHPLEEIYLRRSIATQTSRFTTVMTRFTNLKMDFATENVSM